MADNKKLIWVVDDSGTARYAVKLALSHHDVVEFKTADEAIVKLGGDGVRRPDLILTDNDTQSSKNGMDVITAAKSAGVKSIMISSDNSLEKTAIEKDASGFIVKGKDAPIKSTVEQVLAQNVARGESTQAASPAKKAAQQTQMT